MKTLNQIMIRERIIKLTREYFYSQKFHEVITPVLSQGLPLESNIHAFSTNWKTIKGNKKLYLSTSPENNLKKMLALGIGNCFSIGHSFRNLENSGPLHTPEFLMLEWYRVDANYHKIMEDIKKYLIFLISNFQFPISKQISNFKKPISKFSTLSLADLFLQHTGQPIEKISDSDFFQLFVNKIEPRLPQSPCFITDFPSHLSPLCKPKNDNPYLAERFEFYWKGIELGNGNTENTDVKSIKKHFEEERKLRKKLKLDCPPVDTDFLDSLDLLSHSGLPYAGVGLGLDRLAMIFSSC